jgi:hypothetical protein
MQSFYMFLCGKNDGLLVAFMLFTYQPDTVESYLDEKSSLHLSCYGKEQTL